MKRKTLWLAARIFILVILSSCALQTPVTLVEGNVYIQYGWDTGVWSVTDNNPAFLYVTAQNQNYLSDTGTYYASYKTMY